MKKRLLTVLLTVCMVFGLFPPQGTSATEVSIQSVASGECGEHLTWTLSDNGTLLINGYGPMTEFSTSNSVPWHEYASSAIKEIILGDQVTSIGRTAFADCRELTYVNIPSTVMSIGEYAFKDCSNLATVVIPSNVSTMGKNIFQNCSNLKSAGPIGGDYDIQFGWTEVIPANAFCTIGQAITSAVIPEGIKVIGENAFSLTKITSIQLPTSLTSIGASAFSNTKLSSVSIPGKVTSIGESAFMGCTDLTNVAISAGVTTIGTNAFYNTGYYNDTANWENDVLYIDNYLIKAATSISGDYKIKDGTYCIADSAFSNSAQVNYGALTSVIMPSSLAYIGREAFYRCRNMTGVYFEGNAPTICPGGVQGGSFYDHTKLYYIEGKEGWNIDSSGRWCGYPTSTWEGNPCQHVYGEWVVVKEATPTTDGQRERVCSICGNIETAIIPATGGSSDSLANITILYPANGSTFDFGDTSNDTRMRIFFDREVASVGGGRPELDFSVGTLEVYEVSDDTLVYRVQYGTEVSLWNVDGRPTAIVLQNATAALDYETEYYVTMPEGFIKLADGSVSPAIEERNWIFTTQSQQIVEPSPAPGTYAFDWNENQTPIHSLSDNLVITMTALAKLGYSTFEQSDRNQSVSNFVKARKYSELYDKDNPTDVIWEIDGEALGSYSQFYRDVIGDYIVYDYCDDNSNSGFYAVCFKSPDGKYVISYRGSEGDMGAGIWHLIDSNSGTSSDWSTDLDFALRNTLSEQFLQALQFYTQIEGAVGSENIVLTGHSLGGALAGYVSLCTGARAYTIDGAVGHIIDTTFWEPFWTVYSFTGANNLNLVNLTDELEANLPWPFDVGDAIQATKLNKYPMVTYESLHSLDSSQVKGIFAAVAGSHHPLSYLTYNPNTHRYTLGKSTMIYNCDTQWENDIIDYIPMIKTIISTSNLSAKLKNIFGQLIFNRGRVQLGTTGNDIIKAPSIIGVDSFVNNRQFGGYGNDKLTGYFDSDVLVSKGNGSVLDGQGGSDIYFIDDECRYTVIDDPGGNDTIILRNWDFDSIAIQDTGEFVRIADSHRLVTVNKNRSIFSKNKIEVLWANNTCSQTKTVCSDLIQEAAHNQSRMEILSLERSTSEASAIRLIVIEGTAEISIYNSEKSLISDTIFSNKDSDSTVYTDYAYYYGYNNDTDNSPYAVLYLFNDGYTVNISSAGNISAALYQYNDSESELVAGSYIENLVVPEAQTLAIVSDGSDEGFYLVEGDNGTKIDKLVSFIYAQSVSLSQTNINLRIGSSITLFANATPIEAIIDGNWYSSNHDVATVDDNGKVIACGIGSAEISFVSINGKTASCNVTVISTGNSGEANDSPSLPGNEYLYSGNDSSKYIVSVPNVNGGKISVNPSRASKGRTVTLTATPNEGYELAALAVTDSNGNEMELTDKGNGKYSFVMPNSEVTVIASFQPIQNQDESQPPQSTPWINPFTDVVESAWYYDAVKFVSENGLMNGIGNNLFAPDANLSRAQLAQILYNKEGNPAAGGSSPFTDVNTVAWYSNAVIWAAEKNIVGGYGNGLFGPDDNITREQLAVMLWRYAGVPTANSNLTFSDVGQISDFAQDAIRWAVENKILNGKGNNILDPKGFATRAEVAQMLKNYLDN